MGCLLIDFDTKWFLFLQPGESPSAGHFREYSLHKLPHWLHFLDPVTAFFIKSMLYLSTWIYVYGLLHSHFIPPRNVLSHCHSCTKDNPSLDCSNFWFLDCGMSCQMLSKQRATLSIFTSIWEMCAASNGLQSWEYLPFLQRVTTLYHLYIACLCLGSYCSV